MATNDFKPFATGAGANVMSQSDWEALPALPTGFQAGKASSSQVNKGIRQATVIGALVGQFIANSGADALDDGDVTALVTKFTNALSVNLGLGTAAKKNVGTGTGQIPDMSSFTTGVIKAFKLPTGHIVQFDSGVSDLGGVVKSYPIPFPTACDALIGIIYSATAVKAFVSSNISGTINAYLTVIDPNGNGISGITVGYIAIGH